MKAEQEGLRVSISVSRKVNLGNYSSADLFLAVSNIEIGASETDIQEAIDTGEIAFSVVERAIQQKVQKLIEQRDQVRQQQQARPAPSQPKEVRP